MNEALAMPSLAGGAKTGRASTAQTGEAMPSDPSFRDTIVMGWRSFTETGEGEMARNRLVIALLILSYFLIEWGMNGRPLITPVVTISAFALFSAALAAHILWSPEENSNRRIVAMFADLGTLSFGLYIGEEITACTWPIYLWVIYGNGFRFGQKYLMLSALIATVSFYLVISYTPFWQGFHNLSHGLLVGLIILPLYARKLIRDLSIARREAEEANRAKSMFLASVSHELRTPLNAIIGLSECLISTRLNGEQQEMLSTVNTSGRTLCNLIENILDFSRLESGAMPSHEKDFHLPTLIAEVCSVASAQASTKGIRVNTHIFPHVPARAVSDPLKLTQILTNFLANAVKFTDEGHVTLSVHARQLDTKSVMLRFEVNDTGIGISTQGQARIFERFTQEHDRIVDTYGGTGLGLAIVKQTAELLGGKVGVDSTQGQGSTFWCEIPVSEASQFLSRSTPPRAELAVFAERHEIADRILRAAASRSMTVLSSEAELKTWISAKCDIGSTCLLFVDAESQRAASQAVRKIDNPRLKLVRVRNSRREASEELAIQRQAIAQIQLKSLKRDLMPLVTWIEDLCDKKYPAYVAQECHYEPLSILIAEDNTANQLVVRKILEGAGHQITVVSNGVEAMSKLADNIFDVILLDLNMPVMNGFEALKLMRFAEHDRDVPIIALTADATVETAERCRECGFDAVLTKPYRSTALLSALQKYAKAIASDANAVDGKDESPCSTDCAPHDDPEFSLGCEAEHPEVLDVEQLEEIQALGGNEFLREIVGQFASNCERHILLLNRAVQQRQAEEIRKMAHAIRSCALNLGASQLVVYCTKLENSADHADQASVQSLSAALSSAFEESVDALEHYMAFQEPDAEPELKVLTFH